ncbi:SMI1/KNR4 family protein [Kitasatospora purpeofusca]
MLTPDEIAEVEAQYGVGLPDEYRAFLAEDDDEDHPCQ